MRARPDDRSHELLGRVPRWRTGRPMRCSSSQGYVEGIRLAGGRALVLPADPLWADEPDDVLDHARRPDGGRRRRHRPRALRRRPSSRDRRAPRAPRRGRDRPADAGARARHAGARHLPRHAADQRGARRHASTSTWPTSIDIRPHRADDRTLGTHGVATVPGHARGAASWAPADGRARTTTRGSARLGDRPRGLGPGRRRRGRGDRGSGAAVLPRRAVAPRRRPRRERRAGVRCARRGRVGYRGHA